MVRACCMVRACVHGEGLCVHGEGLCVHGEGLCAW